MISKNTHYIFAFCTSWDFASAKKACAIGMSAVRLCYVTTQKYRLYLTLHGSVLEYYPCVSTEHQWIPATLLSRVAPPEGAVLFTSAMTLEKEMTKAFFVQFPMAEESYYDVFPTCRELLSILDASPNSCTLKAHLLRYTCDERRAVEDADGVASIYVDEGVYMVPYEYINSESDEFVLQMYRGKLHPSNQLAYWTDRVFEQIENVLGSIGSIRFGRIRTFINNFW